MEDSICTYGALNETRDIGDLEIDPFFAYITDMSISGVAFISCRPKTLLVNLAGAWNRSPLSVFRSTSAANRLELCDGLQTSGCNRAASLLLRAGVRRLHVLSHDKECAPMSRLLRCVRKKHIAVVSEQLRSTLLAMRVQKRSDEILAICRACARTDAMFRALWRNYHREQSTAEMMRQIQIKERVYGISYATILVSGTDIARDGVHPSFKPRNLQDANAESFVLLDLGYRYGNYCSDITRTFPVTKIFTPMQRLWYGIVLDAFRYAVTLAVPGELFDDIHLKTLRYMHRLLQTHTNLLTETTLDAVAVMGLLMPHHIGHSVGINVHDDTPTPWRLAENHVFALEPGIYFDIKLCDAQNGLRASVLRECAPMGGIRIEDTFVLCNGAAKSLSNLPLEPDEIERALQR